MRGLTEPSATPLGEVPTIRAFLVDDHAVVREGLISILERERDIAIVGEASSAEDALDALPDADPDVVIVDIRLPGMGGLELCRELAERRIRARAIVLSAYLEDEVVHAAWLAGASAYIVKDVAAEELKRAIRIVAQGGHVIDPKVAGSIVGWATRLDLGSGDRLPPSQQRVLQLLCQGKSNALIAASTGLNQETVKKYLGRIYRRLGAQGRTTAVVEARRRGLC